MQLKLRNPVQSVFTADLVQEIGMKDANAVLDRFLFSITKQEYHLYRTFYLYLGINSLFPVWTFWHQVNGRLVSSSAWVFIHIDPSGERPSPTDLPHRGISHLPYELNHGSHIQNITTVFSIHLLLQRNKLGVKCRRYCWPSNVLCSAARQHWREHSREWSVE